MPKCLVSVPCPQSLGALNLVPAPGRTAAKGLRMLALSIAPAPRDHFNAMDQSGRRRWRRPLGLRTAVVGADAAGSGGNPPPRPGQIAQLPAGRQSRRQGLSDAGYVGGGALGLLRLLPG